MFSLNTENSLIIMIMVHNVVPCHMQRTQSCLWIRVLFTCTSVANIKRLIGMLRFQSGHIINKYVVQRRFQTSVSVYQNHFCTVPYVNDR